jgi:hypothetical protein
MNPLIDVLMVLWVALACAWVAWETCRLLDWWDGLQQARDHDEAAAWDESRADYDLHKRL